GRRAPRELAQDEEILRNEGSVTPRASKRLFEFETGRHALPAAQAATEDAKTASLVGHTHHVVALGHLALLTGRRPLEHSRRSLRPCRGLSSRGRSPPHWHSPRPTPS